MAPLLVTNEEDPSCAGADSECAQAQVAAADAGLPPLRSFVFPQNVIGHVDALAPAGFKCYRETDGGVPARAMPTDAPVSRFWRTPARCATST